MDVSKVIGANIQTLMENHQMSLRKLSDIIGVSHPTLKKYIEGSHPIDSDKLMTIARYFQKPFEYFFAENHAEIPLLFRADRPDKSVHGMDLERFRETIKNIIDIMGNTAVYYRPQKYQFPPSMTWEARKEMLEKIAREQRRLANIENVIPDNYFDVIAHTGIQVIARDFHHDAYFGVSSFSKEWGSFILVNDAESISEERKIFSLIHEYAHLLFHTHQYAQAEEHAFYVNAKSDIHERMADRFAGYFLMPRHLVDSYIDSRSSVDLIDMKQTFKVSIQTLYVMLYEYKVISKAKYQELWNHLKESGDLKKEPHPLKPMDIQSKNQPLIEHIKALYHHEAISASKISEVLGLDIINTRHLLKEWELLDNPYLFEIE